MSNIGFPSIKHYYALGQRIAFRNSKIVDGTPISNQLYYALNDHLGSLRVALDSQGEVVWQGDYDAFGVVQGSAPTHLTTRLYTNQRYEPAVRLYHYGSRFYDPTIGQFIQPDSIIPDPMNPLAWNRYAYVYQNPVNYVDPDGHVPWLAALAGGAFNVIINGGMSHITGQEYDRTDASIDFVVGATFGGLIYGIGASPIYAMTSAPTRMVIMGGLGTTEAGTAALIKGDEFTTNDAAWAFIFGAAFAGLGEISSRRFNKLGNRYLNKWTNSLEISSASRKEMQLANKTVTDKLSSNLLRAVENGKLYGARPPRALRAWTKYIINKHIKLNRSMYIPPNASLQRRAIDFQALGITAGIIAADSEFGGLFKPFLPNLPHLLSREDKILIHAGILYE